MAYEIAARMRQSSPDQVPKAFLVALTRYDSPADRAKTLAADFDHHPSKPAHIDTILTLISGHLHSAAGNTDPYFTNQSNLGRC